MGTITVEQHVDAPVDVVFTEAIDLANAAERFRGVNKIEVLTEAPFRVGTRWRETRTMFGRDSTEEFEVTRFDPPHGYTATCESCGCECQSTLQFAPSGDGASVTMDVTTRPITTFAKLMSPLSACMSGGMKKMLRQELEDLKTSAEARARTAAV